jgi:hypothetical protein
VTGKNERAKRETRRRFEQWARNPQCHANVVSAVHNVKMGLVARRENPSAPREGQSVFALARGRTFEDGLVRDDGSRLLEALRRAVVLSADARHFADHRTVANGGKVADLDTAVQLGHTFLASLADGTTFDGAIASLTVRIPRGIMLPEALLVIDVLAVHASGPRPMIAVGEVKTYADQGGHTSRHDLATARAQMGLYVHALDVTLDGLGLADRIDVSRQGFLVLTYPGSNQPSVRSGEDLTYQLARARRGFELMEQSALSLNGEYGGGDDDDPESLVDLVRHADTHFQDSCLTFCERADHCHQRAFELGRGVVLGDDVERFLNGVSLARVDELLGGSTPVNRVERDLLARLDEGLPVLP